MIRKSAAIRLRPLLVMAFLFLGFGWIGASVYAEEIPEDVIETVEITQETNAQPTETAEQIPEVPPQKPTEPSQAQEEVSPVHPEEVQPSLQPEPQPSTPSAKNDVPLQTAEDDNDKIEELVPTTGTTHENLVVQKAWTLTDRNNKILYLRDWINQMGLTGESTFEIKFDNLSSGTFRTALNGVAGNNLVIRNGVGRFSIPIAWVKPGLDNTADSTFVAPSTVRPSYYDLGTSSFIIYDVPVGTKYTITELMTTTNIGNINWLVESYYSDYYKPSKNAYGFPIPYTDYKYGSSVSGVITNVDVRPSLWQNVVTFMNTKDVSYNVTIKKEVSGKITDETFEVLIIPYQWNDAKTRFNIAMVTSVEKLKAIDVGREDYEELVDLEFFAKELKYMWQLTVPDHGENWYAYLESIFSQIEKYNAADAGYMAQYDYELAKRFVDILNEETNFFFADDAEHFLQSAKNFEQIWKDKGYTSFEEYLRGVYEADYQELTEDDLKAVYDEFIQMHRDAGFTKGDFAFIHMIGHLGFVYYDPYQDEISGIEMYKDYEYYDEIRKLLRTTVKVKHGDVIDVTEYLKYTDSAQMVLIFEKDYSKSGYKRTGVISNWINLLDFTLEELLLGDGTIELTNVLHNVYELPEVPEEPTEEEETPVEEKEEPKEEPKAEQPPVARPIGIQTGLENATAIYSLFASFSLAGCALLKKKH
ncbi:MAG: hypothetical protein J6D18_01860 [Erysipelotrichaceae bacterium]|nr:hypothetical protein [Erysipelotrichaceae bacterium]